MQEKAKFSHPLIPGTLWRNVTTIGYLELQKRDAIFLRAYVELTKSDPLREVHRKFVDRLIQISRKSEAIQRSHITSIDEKQIARDIVIEVEDDLQTQIEQDANLILSELRHGRTAFIHDYVLAMKFFRFISHQYFRTKRIREAIGRGDIPNIRWPRFRKT